METLYILLVLLVATRFCGELAVRLRQPALVGELLSGILLGSLVISQFPHLLPFLTDHREDDVFRALTNLGVFFLMLLAGLELRPADLMIEKGRSIAVAVGGMVLPFASGVVLGWYALPESEYKFAQTFFLGTALAITAIPVAVKVLMDLNLLGSRVGQLVVVAALVDDVLGLLLLALLTGFIQTGSTPSLAETSMLVLNIAVFFVSTTVVGRYVVPWIARKLRPFLSDEQELSGLLIVGLGYAIWAEALGLHFILGAFMAGLLYTREISDPEPFDQCLTRVKGLTLGFFAPVFFASIGLSLSMEALTEIPVFVVVFIVVAILGKFVGAGGPALAAGLDIRDASAVGIGMSARGAVELVIADIALQAGLFDHPTPPDPLVANLFSATVIMAIATTVFAPIGIRFVARRPPDPAEDS